MRAEMDAICGDVEALAFALGCLRAALQWRIADWAISVLRATHRAEGTSRHGDGLACAMLATAMGCALMSAMNASKSYLLVHAATAGIAGILLRFAPVRINASWRPFCLVAGGLTIFCTACAASGPEELGRWLRVGPVSFQPAWILLPAMLVWLPATKSRLALFGVGEAAVGVALQGDAMLATIVAVAAGALAWHRRTFAHAALAAWTLTSLIVAWDQAPNWVPMPFVDGIVLAAFAHGPTAGLMTLIGLALLPLPGVIGLRRETGDTVARSACMHFALAWGTASALALLDAQPAPLLSFGGSAVLGYFLAIAALPARARKSPRAQADHAPDAHVDRPGPPLPRAGPLDAPAP